MERVPREVVNGGTDRRFLLRDPTLLAAEQEPNGTERPIHRREQAYLGTRGFPDRGR